MRLPRSWGSYLVLTTLSIQQGTQLSLVAPLLNDWGYSPSWIGALVSAISVASLVARMPTGLLYRRQRARRVQGIAIPALAVLLVLHPFATEPLAFLAVRVLSGLLYGVATTVNLARFIDEQPLGAERARTMGYYVAGIAVGYSISSLLVGYVVEAAGYVAAFGAGALLTLAGLLGLLDPTPPAAGAPVTEPERRSRAVLGMAVAPSLDPRWLLAAPGLAVALIEGFLLNAQWAFWNAWLPLYTLAVGISLAETGLLRTAYGIFNAGARLVTGDLVARLGAARLAFASLVLQSLLLVLLPVLPRLAPLVAIFVLMGALRAVGIVANTVAVVEQGEALRVGRGPLVGLLNTVTDLGLLAGPALGGVVAETVGPVRVFLFWPLAMLACYLAIVATSRLGAAHSG